MRILGTLFDEPGTCRNYELRLPPMLITKKKLLQLKSEKMNHLRQGLDCVSMERWRHGAPQCEHISHLLGTWDHEHRGLNLESKVFLELQLSPTVWNKRAAVSGFEAEA